MSQSRVVWSGLDALRHALHQLPAELQAQSAEIVTDAAELTKASLIQSYPRGDTGNLRAGVKLNTVLAQGGVMAVVRSTSPHAHLWEFGTEIRSTRQGWNRGRSPSHHRDGLIPIAQRNRRQMFGHLVALVRTMGFDVSGVV